MAQCNGATEIYARVCGFFRPLKGWNKGKKEEYKERTEFNVKKEETHE